MTRATDELSQREISLQQQGADPLRLELLRRARSFKRSWIDMADGLLQVKQTRAFEEWGYADLYAYCDNELMIKKRTVDKLTGSFSTIQQHAPEVLQHEDALVPNYDAVDYFKRVVDAPDSSPDDHDVAELRAAVFEQGQPVADIRKHFNPIFFAKSTEDVTLEALLKTSRTADKLDQLVIGIEELSEDRVAEVQAALEALRRELDELIPRARERAEMSRAA